MDVFTRFTKLLTAIGLLSLAAAIIFFSFEVQQLRKQLPTILNQVDETVQRVSPIIDELSTLQKFLPQIIEQSQGYQQLIPEVLARIDIINQQVPIITNEVSIISQSIAPILKQTETWRLELPMLLKRVDETNKTIASTNLQIEQLLPTIPLILAESEALRNDIPVMLSEADTLIEKAEQAGQNASKGVVTGFVGGILSTPFSLIGKLSENTIKILRFQDPDTLSKQDKQFYNQAMNRLMKKPIEGNSQSWKNVNTGNKGTITISEVVQKEQQSCYQFISQFVIAEGDDQGSHELATEACKDN